MANKLDRISRSHISPAAAEELGDDVLNKIVGGNGKEAPKEEITFEYGALVIQYRQQSSY